MNGINGVEDACALRVVARAQAAGNEFLPDAATLYRFPDRGFDQAGECLATAKHALSGLTQFGLYAQGREGGGLHRVRCKYPAARYRTGRLQAQLPVGQGSNEAHPPADERGWVKNDCRAARKVLK